MSWSYDTIINPDGFGIFVVKAWTNDQGAAEDITFFRGVPTLVDQMTFADPFGDATAVITLPQVTGFDGPYTDPPTNSIPSETWWLKEYANIDIYWVPATSTPNGVGEAMIINPLTQMRDLYLHTALAVPVWEGYIVTISPSREGTQIQCQGALYQLDRYYAKPLYPSRPKTVESMIERYFDPIRRGLWTKKLRIDWEPTWPIQYDAAAEAKFMKKGGLRFVPTGIKPGATYGGMFVPDPNWTGYVTRNTGAWEKALTGYVQGQLSILYTRPSIAKLTANVWFAETQWPNFYFQMSNADTIAIGDVVTITGVGAPFDGAWAVTWSAAGEFRTTMPSVDPGYTFTYPKEGFVTYPDPAGGDATGTGTIFMQGDQWTILKDPGRQPYMAVRRQLRDPDYQVWYGQPGVDARINRDGNQANNVVYGQGKGVDETSWSKQIFPNGNWSTYGPLSAKPEVWWGDVQSWGDTGKPFPLEDLYDGYWSDWERQHGINVVERYITNFPDGIDLDDAEKIAASWLERDSDPGWSGTIDLQVDPQDFNGQGKSKWLMKAGEAILLRGFQGTGGHIVRGTNVFHISQVQMNIAQGTVTLTVDSKFRDLLTVEEAIIHGRDSLSAVKALQVGKRSAIINDLVMPWNNTAGSGFVPTASKDMDRNSYTFPYTLDTTATPPSSIFKAAYLPGGNGKAVQGDTGKSNANSVFARLKETVLDGKKAFYVPVHAGASNKTRRWAIVPCILSQAGTIARTEFCAYDQDGNPAPVEFHVSVYLVNGQPIDTMPWAPDTGEGTGHELQHAALWDGAFETLDRQTNLPWPAGDMVAHAPADSFHIGWGTYERPAGYSPGTKPSAAATTATPTGQLIDGASWDYSFVDNMVGSMPASGKEADAKPITSSQVSASIAIYAQIPDWYTNTQKANLDWVYFIGRFYRNIGVN